jgi:hypothetical protein
MKIHDPHYPGPSASLLETEETPQKKQKGILTCLNQQLKEISKWKTIVIS